MYTLLKKIIICSVVNASLTIAAFGQNIVPAGARPEVFTQQGVDSTSNQSVAAFLGDGKTAYLADGTTIYFTKKINGNWTKPVLAPFSGHWKDWDPTLRPDGKRLIFVSNRPADTARDQSKPQKSNHLWYVDRISGDRWTAPRHFDAPVNLVGFNDYGPSISAKGTLCFCSRNRDGHNGMGGYAAKLVNGHYEKPELLALNGDNEIYDPFIAPDEHYIIFVSNNELYISYRKGGGWTQGEKLGPEVNNGKANFDPCISSDGKTLYYAQDKAPGILMIPVNIPAS